MSACILSQLGDSTINLQLYQWLWLTCISDDPKELFKDGGTSKSKKFLIFREWFSGIFNVPRSSSDKEQMEERNSFLFIFMLLMVVICRSLSHLQRSWRNCLHLQLRLNITLKVICTYLVSFSVIVRVHFYGALQPIKI